MDALLAPLSSSFLGFLQPKGWNSSIVASAESEWGTVKQNSLVLILKMAALL